MSKINIQDKLNKFSDYWTPKIVGELNDSYVKLAKFKGEFVWHAHECDDEMFLVINGELTIRFRDRDERISEGEFIIIPKGVEHMPCCEDEVHVMLFEPKSVVNTGDVDSELKAEALERI